MTVKELMKELVVFDGEDEVKAYLYDKEQDVEYECEIRVDGDIIPMLVLEEVRRY